MIQTLRVWLWGIVAELEYQLYPWKKSDPPLDIAQKYNLDQDYSSNLHYDWLKAHDEKINKLEENMINVFNQIHTLQSELQQCMKN